MTRALVAGLLCLLPGCGYGPIPTLKMDGSFTAALEVNGRPVQLCVDTGAMCSDLYRDAATRLGLAIGHRSDRSMLLTDSTGLQIELTEFAEDVRYRLGLLRCLVGYVVCLPRHDRSSPEGAIVAGPGIDGHLGMDVMRHWAFWFSAASGQLQVIPGDAVEASIAQRGFTVTQRIGLGADDARPMVRVELDGSEAIELLLDTGASETSLPDGLAGKLALPAGTELAAQRAEASARSLREQLERQGLVAVEVVVPADDGSRIGVHGVATPARPLFHLRSLRLGNREVRDLVVIEDPHSPKIGRDVLGTFDWILHGPRRELWLLEAR